MIAEIDFSDITRTVTADGSPLPSREPSEIEARLQWAQHHAENATLEERATIIDTIIASKFSLLDDGTISEDIVFAGVRDQKTFLTGLDNAGLHAETISAFGDFLSRLSLWKRQKSQRMTETVDVRYDYKHAVNEALRHYRDAGLIKPPAVKQALKDRAYKCRDGRTVAIDTQWMVIIRDCDGILLKTFSHVRLNRYWKKLI